MKTALLLLLSVQLACAWSFEDRRTPAEVEAYLKTYRLAIAQRDELKKQFAPLKAEFEDLTAKIDSAKSIVADGATQIELLDVQADKLRAALQAAARVDRDDAANRLEAKLTEKAAAQQLLGHAKAALPLLEAKKAQIAEAHARMQKKYNDAAQHVEDVEADWKEPRLPSAVTPFSN